MIRKYLIDGNAPREAIPNPMKNPNQRQRMFTFKTLGNTIGLPI